MRFFHNANYDFIGYRKYAYVFSGVLLAISILSLIFRGVETGIDFSGGTEFVVATAQPLSVAEVRSALNPVFGGEPEVKEFGAATSLLVRTTASGDPEALGSQMLRALNERFSGSNPVIEKNDVIAPRFADDLRRAAIGAVIGSLLVIFFYVTIRFANVGKGGKLLSWHSISYPTGAVAALAHDVTITLGMFSLLHGWTPLNLQIDQALIAAFLTIVGYSINDTVVVYDRIREYVNLFKTERLDTVINRAINTTLSRTIITSGTTVIVVFILLLFGGAVLQGFAFALTFGIAIGTYSSIFVASPIVLELEKLDKRA